jgi:predicted acylesterase/phospholipase RssA
MVELLVLLLVAVAYALGRAQDERDRLRLRLSELWSGSWSPRTHWQPLDERLATERLIWRQTAAVQRAARQAMRDVVARVAEGEGSHPPTTAASDAARRPPVQAGPPRPATDDPRGAGKEPTF